MGFAQLAEHDAKKAAEKKAEQAAAKKVEEDVAKKAASGGVVGAVKANPKLAAGAAVVGVAGAATVVASGATAPPVTQNALANQSGDGTTAGAEGKAAAAKSAWASYSSTKKGAIIGSVILMFILIIFVVMKLKSKPAVA